MGLLARMIQLKAGQARRAYSAKAKRIDEGLPLKLKVGSTVKLDGSLFVIGQEALLIQPPQGSCVVKAFGRYKLLSHDCYRFYLHDEKETEFVLQISLERGKITEVILWNIFDEIYPETKEDWQAWLEEGQGHIGHLKFGFPDDRLGEVQYLRVFQNPGPDWIRPLLANEQVTDDPCQAETLRVKRQQMVYSRATQANGENLAEFLTLEQIEDPEGAQITIMLGVEMPVISIEVL